ncbi:MAG: alginate O-acetyltransferase complex protein AlgI [Bacteroidia bacterium]|jgi:alginate O-acetyltransferase complex protein AlgI
MLTLKEIFLYSEEAPLIFSQYLFLFIFSIGFLFFCIFHKKLQIRNTYLLLFSLFFYYKSGGLYFGLLLLSTVVDYWCGNAIHKSNVPIRRKVFLILSLFVNLGMLAFFKYSGYLVTLINDFAGTSLETYNFMAALSNGTFGTDFSIEDIFLPVGISFYTFQTLSYTIDIYRRQIKPAKSIIDFGFFVTFFPQLVAGPIVRAADFIPQIYKKYSLTREQFGVALYLIMTGLFKKTVISDYISINFVDRVFDDPNLYSGFSNLMAVYGYSIQIYCDFSGYSDMAIGLAALLGFQLPLNFNSPYKATSITDFWRRWHISLSTWLRDYLYISLGGNRKGKVRTYINLMITMLLGGLWHGAATKFIIWGGLHGAALGVHKLWIRHVPGLSNKTGRLATIVTGLITFHFVAFCWIYFRADNVAKVKVMLNRITMHFDWAGISERLIQYRTPMALVALGFLIHYIPSQYKSKVKQWFVVVPNVAKVLLCAAIIFVCYQAKTADVQPFIYFQF